MFDQECIGRAAGVVWQHLRQQGPAGASLASLKRVRGLQGDEVLAAIGWLAREGKLQFENGSGNLVRLRETELVG
jgi:hypothetical protein